MSRCVKTPPSTNRRGAVRVRYCAEANAEHRKSFRQYAHTYHFPNTICLSDAFDRLSDQWKLAILLHECGHLLVGYEGTEKDANRAIKNSTGIKITYRDGHFGKRLEWISRDDVPRAQKVLFGKAAA